MISSSVNLITKADLLGFLHPQLSLLGRENVYHGGLFDLLPLWKLFFKDTFAFLTPWDISQRATVAYLSELNLHHKIFLKVDLMTQGRHFL